MDRGRLLARITSGNLANVAFSDFQNLLEGLGYRLMRIRGDHYTYQNADIPDVMVVQPLRRQAKKYQLRQLSQRIERYNLRLED